MTAAAKLTVKAAPDCRFDAVSLGEVMLRLDPGEGRVHTTRTFQAWEGGGEYNVRAACAAASACAPRIVTALADNPVGRLVEDLMLQGGVDLSYLRWKEYDGVGRSVRNGLNFTERGFGPRGGVGCSDRGHTAVSQMLPGDVDWQQLFGAQAGRAGSTRAACSARCRRGRRRSRTPRWKKRTSTAPACRTTSTTAIRCGGRSAARCRRARSTGR